MNSETWENVPSVPVFLSVFLSVPVFLSPYFSEQSLAALIGHSVASLWKEWSRDMQLSSMEPAGFVIAGECPHCLKHAAFPTITQPYEQQGRKIAAARCIACNEYILMILTLKHIRGGEYQWVYAEHYPIGKPDDTLSEDIPEQIRTDFQEAIRAEWIKAYKASVLMCRRSLQTSCDMEGAMGNDLFNQIDDLAVKQKLTQTLKDMAHRIRLLGKKGAHGDYSDIDDTMTPQDADDAITFMHHYLEHVYILPAKLAVPLKGTGKKRP